MILSVSQMQSTLYDQITYSGSPSSFAWVLPTKGMVTVGVSSDALFEELDALTAVTVQAPHPPPVCGCSGGGFSSAESSSATTTSTTSSSSGGVNVIAQKVVGPYETVQLSSTTPNALTDWLTMHGYAIPPDVAPIIAAYLAGGFDFLAVKLVPGVGIDAMVPISVTTPGASPVLPLRMVAAGAGATVPITLFVLAEGRYAPTNFPSFTINPLDLTWDYNIESTNYSTLRDQGFMTSNGLGWLIESATPQAESQITNTIVTLATANPLESGYGDAMGNGASQAAQADLATLFAGIAPSSLFITRMLAELPKSALSTDLTLGASADQTILPTTVIAQHVVHDGCPPCSGAGVGSTTGGGGAGGAQMSTGAGGAHGNQTSSSCAVTPGEATPFAAVAAALGLASAASRRRRRSALRTSRVR
jgi:MYXO-CTERM domain-containing protein